MMDRPLTPLHFLDRAGGLFGGKAVVEAGLDGGLLIRTWGDVRAGAARRTAALAGIVAPGDRVAVLAWNTVDHLELYFSVPAAGGVLLMVNVRLAPAQIARVLAHAAPRVIVAEPEFTALVDEALAEAPLAAERWVLGTEAAGEWRAWPADDAGKAGGAPPGDPASVSHGTDEPTEWARTPDEDDPAALCYTSGTTGEPKGVLYSHRALALHTLAICLPDGFDLGEADVILPAVPMFHANAWGLPHAAAMTGASLVLPGARPGAALLADLLSERRVTFAAGVPTVWMGVLDELRVRPRPLSPRLRIHSGGAPSPPALVEGWAELGVEIVTGWGMTELTPVGLVTHPRADMAGLDAEALMSVRTSQGTPLPFVETRLRDDAGRPVPHDGETPGELEVRGPWVTAGYFRRDEPGAFRDGWLRTGDVATVDARGYVRLVDRTKDLIRSGGEWISSVRLEHLLMGHPAVAEAAVVAVADEKWGERPWAGVVLRAGRTAGADEVLSVLGDRVPSWWTPDRVVFLDAIPRTATGKFDKKALRARFNAPLSTPASPRPGSS